MEENEKSVDKSLSEKIKLDSRHPDYDREVLTVSAVKEAIKELKKNVNKFAIKGSLVSIEDVNLIIKEIFGEELVE